MSVNRKYAFIALIVLVAIFTAVFFPFTNDTAHADNNIITTPDHMAACIEGEACILVGATCDGCCNYHAINQKFKEEHNALARETCKSYEGGSCECTSEIRSAKCIEGRCQPSTDLPVQ